MQYQINISKTFVQKPYLNWETSTEAIPKANTYHFFCSRVHLYLKLHDELSHPESLSRRGIQMWANSSLLNFQKKQDRVTGSNRFFLDFLDFFAIDFTSSWIAMPYTLNHALKERLQIPDATRVFSSAGNIMYIIIYPPSHNHGSVEKWIPPILASLRVVLDFDDYGSKSNIKALQSTYSFPNLQFSQPVFDTVWSYSANVAAELPRKKPRWNHPKKWNHMSFVFFSFVVERKLFTASATASAMLPRPQRQLPRHTFHI